MNVKWEKQGKARACESKPETTRTGTPVSVSWPPNFQLLGGDHFARETKALLLGAKHALGSEVREAESEDPAGAGNVEGPPMQPPANGANQ